MFTYTYGAVSDKGDIRAENQDSILYLTGSIQGSEAALSVIADGMGGLSFGAQTSQYITGQFKRWWYEEFPDIVREDMDHKEDIQELLEQEIWDINQAILAFNHQMQSKSGSTLSLLLLHKNQYFIENAGDSRVYLLRGQSLYQLTEDHSLVARMMRHYQLSEEEAKHSVMRNKLTMCIGMFSVPETNYYEGKLEEGDCFLLCSDGLYNHLKTSQIERILGEREFDAVEKAEYLRRMIEPGKASDNVSAIVVQITGET